MVTVNGPSPVAGGWLDCGRAKLQFQWWNFQLSTVVWRGAPAITGRDHMGAIAGGLEIYGLYNPGWWAFQKVIWVEAKKKLVSFVLLFCIWNKTSFEVMTTFLGFTKWMKAEYVEWRWSEVAIFLLNLFGVTSEKQGRCPQHNMNPSKPKGFRQFLSNVSCFSIITVDFFAYTLHQQT